MKTLTVVFIAVLFILHQDFWFWDRIEPLVFGFLPVGLAWHAGISIAASLAWAMAVRYCWPRDVDVAEHEYAAARGDVEL